MTKRRHPCTCETDGRCTTCLRAASTYEIQPYSVPIYCVWCKANITYRAQYTIGDFRSGNKVCGVNCVKRPAAPEKKSMFRVTYNYTVTTQSTIDVYATNGLTARTQARSELTDDGVITISKVESL